MEFSANFITALNEQATATANAREYANIDKSAYALGLSSGIAYRTSFDGKFNHYNSTTKLFETVEDVVPLGSEDVALLKTTLLDAPLHVLVKYQGKPAVIINRTSDNIANTVAITTLTGGNIEETRRYTREVASQTEVLQVVNKYEQPDLMPQAKPEPKKTLAGEGITPEELLAMRGGKTIEQVIADRTPIIINNNPWTYFAQAVNAVSNPTV